jgi:hypothetical protein
MPSETFAWLSRFKEIERDYQATCLATSHLLRCVQAGSLPLTGGLTILDINRALEHLDGIYLTNLFSEFERGLKWFLRARKLKIPRPAERLINRVAARVRIAGDLLTRAHAVREYRNKLVHHLTVETESFTLSEARQCLCSFFARLQTAW